MNELMTAPTTDEIIRNAQYHQAQRVVELLLSKGLITPVKYEKITDINRMTYHPFCKSQLKNVDFRQSQNAV